MSTGNYDKYLKISSLFAWEFKISGPTGRFPYMPEPATGSFGKLPGVTDAQNSEFSWPLIKIWISSKNIRIWKDTLESTSFSFHLTSTKMLSFLHLLSHIRKGTFLAKNWAKKQKTDLWVTIPASYSRLSWPTSVSSTPSAGPREPSRLHSPF